MTKEEKIKEFVEFCGDLAISKDSVNEETVLNFINSIQGKENNGWIKIESEDDLPKDENIVEFWVYDDEEIVSAKFMYESKRWYHDVNLNLRLFPTHYQSIVKPKPPIY